MRILLVNKFFYIRGGAETYFFELGKLLEEQGHTVAYFSMHDNKNFSSEWSEYFAKHIDFVEAKGLVNKFKAFKTTIYSKDAKKKIRALINDFKPDIVHINNYHRQLSCSIIDEIKKHNIPIVFTAHDDTIICPKTNYYCGKCSKGKFVNCFKNQCVHNSKSMSFLGMLEGYMASFRRVIDKIDVIISPSFFLKSELEAAGIPRQKIEVLHNFCSIEGKYENSNDKFLVYLGRFSYEKGIFTLLNAMKSVENFKLLLIGTGPLEEEIKRFLKDEGLEQKIVIAGYKPRNEVFEIVSKCSAVVLPSQRENCSYTIIETMLLGKPVVASNVGGNPELVIDGHNGYIFEYDNSAELVEKIKLLSNDEAQQLGKNALSFITMECNKQKYYKNLIEIYKNLVQ